MSGWVRLWHDMPTDPKWRTIARKSGQPLPCVVAVFAMMLTNAGSNTVQPGTLLSWDHEDAGAALDMDGEDVAAIFEAMQGKVLDGFKLSGWERRQPKREDNSVSRVKAYRDRQRNAEERTGTPADTMKRNVTQCNAPEADADADSGVPLSNDNGPDPAKVMFDAGVKILTAAGHKPAQARSVVGKWRKTYRDDGAIIAALGAAQREGAVDPVGFVEGALRHRTRGKPHDDGLAMPC